MSEEKVRIVELVPARVVRFHGFGPGPEDIAFEKMWAWAKENHYLEKPKVRYFGFNNPDPTPGSPNYGYEIWLTVPEGEKPENIEMVDFSGGLYAVSRCQGKMSDAGSFIPAAWQSLSAWVENSPYQFTHDHQWLEEQIPVQGMSLPDSFKSGVMILDLHLPIKKRN